MKKKDCFICWLEQTHSHRNRIADSRLHSTFSNVNGVEYLQRIKCIDIICVYFEHSYRNGINLLTKWIRSEKCKLFWFIGIPISSHEEGHTKSNSLIGR